MNKKNMLLELSAQLADTSDAGKVKQLRWLNMAKDRVLYDVDLPQLRRTATLTFVKGQYDYVMPADVMRLAPDNTMNIPAEERTIRRVSPFQLKTIIPGLTSETTEDMPEVWADREWVGVLAQPSSASTIKLLSSSASDVTAVTIEGIVGGEIDREVLTLVAGTKTSTKQFTAVHSISKADTSTGRITVTSNSDTVTLGILGPLHYTKRYIHSRFYPITDAAYVAAYDFIPWTPELVNDSDIPLLPEWLHETIVTRALLYGYRNKGDTNYRLAAGEYSDMLAKVREETGRDQGLLKQWTLVDDLYVDQQGLWDFDMFLKFLYWG